MRINIKYLFFPHGGQSLSHIEGVYTHKKTAKMLIFSGLGGEDGTRTHDLLHAMQAL
jgi:hypothetical protein